MSVWPTAFPISQDDSVTSFQHNNVVVPNFDFAEEVHNEDSLYSRLAFITHFLLLFIALLLLLFFFNYLSLLFFFNKK